MPVALPSLGTAVTAAERTLRRFPLAILAAAVSAAGAVLGLQDVGPDWSHERLMASASLGIALFTALQLIGERLRRPGLATALLNLGGIALLVGFFLGWPGWSEATRGGSYLQLSVIFHLLVVTGPFIGRGLPNAFWQYNRVLLERGLLAAAFTGTLFVGVALALVALDKLFGVDVPGTAYPRVWAVIGFVFSSWLFLGGVPEDPAALEERRDYPAVLKVFSQYALVPLVSVYLVILTLYLGKVVVTWDWPNGWIGNLVTGVATAGIFAILLAHPLAEDAEQRWIATFARQFWLAIIPSIAMLWLALYQRVHQYGITEARYTVIALSIWLFALALYYIVTRSRNIRVIPVTLGVLAIVTFAGPWGPYAVSERSQVGRLRAVLARNQMLVDGTLRAPARAVSEDDRAEISGVLRYLITDHGTTSIAPWFADTSARRVVRMAGVRGIETSLAAEDWASIVARRMGVAYAVRRVGPVTVRTFSYTTVEPEALPLRGYDYLVSIRDSATRPADSSFTASWSRRPFALRVFRRQDTLLVVPLDSLYARLRAEARRPGATTASQRPGGPRWRVPEDVTTLPPDLFVTEAEGPGLRARVYLRQIAGRDSAGTTRVETVTGRVLLALKR
jgi:hypothetical protein